MIVCKKTSAIIRFNKKIYKEEAIKKAEKGFNKLAKISTRERENVMEVLIENKNPEKTGLEFCNYVIALMKS